MRSKFPEDVPLLKKYLIKSRKKDSGSLKMYFEEGIYAISREIAA